MNTFHTHSEAETKKVAADLATKLLKNGGIVALYGDLGAGKTTFTQGFAKGLLVQNKILSPTFVLLRQYLIPQTEKTLYHFDLYRLEEASDLHQIGFEEILNSAGNLILIEWAEKAEGVLPKNIIKVEIEKLAGDSRQIKISEFN